MTANAGLATEADDIFPFLTLTSFHSLSPGHITESPLNDRHFAEGAA